ncbi:MAG: hypothetical protein IJ124_07585 [Clostridia bacterium]|nr:hypothetical protein [Clostridia bacterium]
MNVDGDVLAESDRSFFCLCPGYYCAEENGVFALVGPDGVIASGLDQRPDQSSLQVQQYGSDTKTYKTLVLNTGEWSLPIGRQNSLSAGLAAWATNGLYGLYNLFTGEQLLASEYDSIDQIGEFIIAQAGDACHVYRVHCQLR